MKQLYVVQIFVSKTVLGRETVKTSDGYEVFESDDQMRGGRLPEGCTTLPEGFSFTFLKVTLD